MFAGPNINFDTPFMKDVDNGSVEYQYLLIDLMKVGFQMSWLK